MTDTNDYDKILEEVTEVCHRHKIYHTTIQVQSEEFHIDDIVPSLCKNHTIEFPSKNQNYKFRYR